MSEVIRAEQLGKTYAEGSLKTPVFERLDFSVNAGETIAILGASGAGKSTLLHLLGGLDTPTTGEVYVTGQKMSALSNAERGRLRNRALGFIYQFHHLLPELTALENVLLPLLLQGVAQTEAMMRAQDLLHAVGLARRLEHKPGELSGGERQRTAVARALVTRPACVLGDEPTGNLDETTAAGVFELMLELNRAQKTSLGLLIGVRRWLLDLPAAGEIVSGQGITPVPLTKPWYRGLVNVRGNLIGVIDLVSFPHGTQSTVEQNFRIVLFGASLGMPCGLLVAGVLGLRHVENMREQAAAPNAPPWEGRQFVDEDNNVWTELDLTNLVRHPDFLHIGQQALGKINYGPIHAEIKSIQFRRSLYVVEDIEKGGILTSENVRAIRPGFGMAPKYLDHVLNKRINKNVRKGTALTWELIG